VILEAQASGVPVVAVDAGGPGELIAHGRTGLLAPADARALAEEIVYLARRPALRARLAATALAAVGDRSWERALRQLAQVYTATLGGVAHPAASGTQEPALVMARVA
jgi:glycosyltransferase involved in cell wall biosynthesis